jgi:tetratricopeptide (TPR) repeat protein
MERMRSALPAWLNPSSTQIGLDESVERTSERLRIGQPVVWLTGHEALAVAGVAVRRISGGVIGVRLAGCESRSDALLQMGWALDVPVPGSLTDVVSALGRLVDTRIVVDCRGGPRGLAHEFRRYMDADESRSQWLMVVAPDHAPTNAITTGESKLKRPQPDVAKLPLASHALAYLPAGIPGSTKGLGALRVPGISRQALWPDATDSLRRLTKLEPAEVAAELALFFNRYAALAVDGLQPEGAVPADMFALRWIGRVVADPITAGQTTIAAARLMMRWGQTTEARALLAAGLERGLDVGAPATIRALLQWADGRACLAAGDPRTGARRFSDAVSTLRDDRALGLLACMTRRWADVLAVRGDTESASRHYRDSRALYRQAGHSAGVGATLRGAADVSVAAGELVSAEALYDQVDASGGSAIELANLRLGQSVLALHRGEHHRARSLVERAVRSAPHQTILLANGERRRADLALREGHHSDAAEHASAAQEAYARIGATVAGTRCTRLLGDIAAMDGRLKDAANHYRDAVIAQIRIGDSTGLRTSLTHAAVLEEFSGEPELAQEFRRMLNKLDAAARLS